MLNELKLEKIKDIHWKTQESTSDSVLFYRLGNNDKDLLLLHERLLTSKYQTLILNIQLDQMPENSIFVDESEWPKLQKEILDRIYPLPSLKFMAVTGTNGKTTTADLVLQIGEQIGKRGMSIGTLGVRVLNQTILDFGLTSPSFIDLRKFIHAYGADKDFCVMEASSHALIQERLYGLEFDSAGWLSFSQDHLDYHQTMEAYFNAKSLVLKKLKPNAKLFVPSNQKSLFDELKKVSDRVHKAKVIEAELPVFFKAKFNKNNLEVAMSMIADVFNVETLKDFKNLIPPDGRFFIRPYKTNFIIVDFAHTPDALENICQGIKEAFPRHKLKVLFGCGGDRDRSKRSLMGAVVSKWAQVIYVTSDNPRGEDPKQIIQDILRGISKNTIVEVDRKIAVQKAFEDLGEHEILLLAGKGHEDYILIKGIKHPYSDIKEVENFVGRTPS